MKTKKTRRVGYPFGPPGDTIILHKPIAETIQKETPDKIKCHFCGTTSEYGMYYIAIAAGRQKMYLNDDFTQETITCSDCLPKLRIVREEVPNDRHPDDYADDDMGCIPTEEGS